MIKRNLHIVKITKTRNYPLAINFIFTDGTLLRDLLHYCKHCNNIENMRHLFVETILVKQHLRVKSYMKTVTLGCRRCFDIKYDQDCIKCLQCFEKNLSQYEESKICKTCLVRLGAFEYYDICVTDIE